MADKSKKAEDKKPDPRLAAAGVTASANPDAQKESDKAPPQDPSVKVPSETRLPGHLRSFGGPDHVPGETNLDPLGTGGNPGNYQIDPTDTRATGKFSEAVVRVDSGDVENAPRRLPSVAGFVDEDDVIGMDARGAVIARPARSKPEILKGETVMLTAPHYLNDEMFEAGAVLEDYHGPRSKNMVVEGEDETVFPSKARDRQPEISFSRRG